MMKKLAKWLSEHAIILGDGGKDSVVYLYSILISFILIILFVLLGWRGQAFEWLCGVLYLGGSLVPPIVAGAIALVKKEPWNPWYWFPIVIGNVVGGIFAIIISYICGLA